KPVYQKVSSWITDNTDPAGPHALDGVNRSGWTFLRAAGNINSGSETTEGLIGREYTRTQFKFRFGRDPGDSLINKMSNSIAFSVFQEVLRTGQIPDIDTIDGGRGNHVLSGGDGGERSRRIYVTDGCGAGGHHRRRGIACGLIAPSIRIVT